MRGAVEPGDFIEIYCDTPLDICETRDVKGLYKKARVGEILEFTGISSPYQIPEKPELIVNTGTVTLDACVKQIIVEMIKRGVCALQPDVTLESGNKKHCQESGIKL